MKIGNGENLIQQYFGFSIRQAFIYIGLVAIVIVITTVAYTSIFGLKTWETNMSQAGSLMLSNVETPLVPVMGAPGMNGMIAQPNTPAADTNPLNQFFCSTCGVVGTPSWDQIGTPLCPACGAVMNSMNQVQNSAALAAQQQTTF